MSLELSDKRVLMAGGTGLVGSHLAVRLSEDSYMVVADDLSKGDREQVPDGVGSVQADVTNPDDVVEVITEDSDIIFHLAAYTDTNYGNLRQLFEENTEMTYNALERMQEVGVSDIAFTSSSTIYSEALRPTPEDYVPLKPISIYDSSRFADEGPLLTFAHSCNLTVYMYRFVNIVGPNQRGSIIPDPIEKFLEDLEMLEILGDGRQEKSYLHVEDCIDTMCHVVEHVDHDYNVYNLGTRTTTFVTIIANIVADALDLDPGFEYTGSDRGWTGDMLKMRLSIEKFSAFGWKLDGSSDETVRRVAEELAAELRAEYE